MAQWLQRMLGEGDKMQLANGKIVFWTAEDPETRLWYFEAAWFDEAGEFREYQSPDFSNEKECLEAIRAFEP